MVARDAAGFELETSELRCTLSRIKVSSLRLRSGLLSTSVAFDLGAEMGDVETTNGSLRMKYKLYIDTNPAVERAELEGVLTIRNSKISPLTDLAALGAQVISEMAMQVYLRNYFTIYLTFESMGLPAPSPLLVREPSVVKGEILSDSGAGVSLAPIDQPLLS